MKAIIAIYKIVSPSNKIYIGKSVDVYTRWKKYEKLKCKTQTRLYHSLKKYGWDAHKKEIFPCDESQLNELEKYYVDLFQTFNSKHGMNLRDGGGNKGRHSEETKIKIAKSNTGKVFTNDRLLNMRNSHIGKKHTQEHKDKISKAISLDKNGFYGRTHSESTKKHWSKIRSGRKTNRGRLILNIENGVYYNSVLDAAATIQIKHSTLRWRLNHGTSTNFIYA